MTRFLSLKTGSVLALGFALAFNPTSPVFSPALAQGGAEEEGLEALLFMEIPQVVTASLKQQTIDEVPGTMTVITDTQIKLLGLLTLKDALHLIPNVEVHQETYGTSNPSFRHYRFAGTGVLMLLDGRRTNTEEENGARSFLFRPLDDIKQIEVIRGPGSSLYGTNAFVGVINLVTRKTPGGSFSLTAGTFDHKAVHLDHASDTEKDFRYRVSLSQSDEEGDDLLYERDALTGFFRQSIAPEEKNKYKKASDVLLSAEYKDFGLTAGRSKSTTAWTESPANILTPQGAEVLNEFTFLDGFFKHRFSESSHLTLKAGGQTTWVDYQGQYLPPGFTDFVSDIDRNGIPDVWLEGLLFDDELRVNSHFFETTYQHDLERQSIILGAYYGKTTVPPEDVRSKRNLPLVRGLYNDFRGSDRRVWMGASADHEEANLAVYAQDIFALTEQHSLILGARFDDYEIAGTAFSPRAAFIWNGFLDQIVKFSYGEAMSAPYLTARYNRTSFYAGNPDLEPQKIKTWEAAIQNPFEKVFHYALVLYRSDIHNGFEFISGRSVPYQNSGTPVLEGVEFEFKWNLQESSHLWGNISHGTNEVNGTQFRGIEDLANLGFVHRLTDNLGFSIWGKWTGDYHPNPNIRNRDFSDVVDAYTTVNTSLGYTGISNLTLQLIVRNVFDEEYFTYNDIDSFLGAAGTDFPSEGRQILLKGTYVFG